MRCKTICELRKVKKGINEKIPVKAVQYILEENYEEQFPVACIQICGTLYGHTISGLVESMNIVNISSPIRNLDVFNTIIEIVKLEKSRFLNFPERSSIPKSFSLRIWPSSSLRVCPM